MQSILVIFVDRWALGPPYHQDDHVSKENPVLSERGSRFTSERSVAGHLDVVAFGALIPQPGLAFGFHDEKGVRLWEIVAKNDDKNGRRCAHREHYRSSRSLQLRTSSKPEKAPPAMTCCGDKGSVEDGGEQISRSVPLLEQARQKPTRFIGKVLQSRGCRWSKESYLASIGT